EAAAAAGKRLDEQTAPFVQAFFEDRDYLRILPAHVYPRATQSVPAMARLVAPLPARGVAYKGEEGSSYFATAKFPSYGRLSRLDTRELKAGARVASDEYAKDDPRDFALWKKAEPADEQVGAAWDAPFGRGRPGWHLECSAMSLEQIEACCHTQTLDIHAGGVDLIFPHHEAAITPQAAATGRLVDLAAKLETDVRSALDDEVNAPRACAALFQLVHDGHAALDVGAGGAAAARVSVERAMAVLDILPSTKTVDPALVGWVEERLAARDKARKGKDFKAADQIRAELAGRGVEI